MQAIPLIHTPGYADLDAMHVLRYRQCLSLLTAGTDSEIYANVSFGVAIIV